jgi:FkbM family methyltransferase
MKPNPSPYTAAARRPLYRAQFGWWLGYKNWRAVYSNRLESSVYLPRYKTNFHLRPGTTDPGVFEAFFLQRPPYILPANLKPKLIIDGGANIGCASVFFAKKYSGATILAVEPDPQNARLCAENTSRYRGVRVIKGALWPRDTWLQFESPDVHNTEFRVVETARQHSASLQAFTIPALLEMAGADRVDILKLDIEGAERELFAENADWITKVGILIIELHDRFRPGSARELYRAITQRSLEFTQGIQGENTVIFFNAAGHAKEVPANFYSKLAKEKAV